MPTVHFRLQTVLSPDAVLAALTDFDQTRADIWPNIDRAHFHVHTQGPDSAEVTEGSSVAGGVWERNRYQWDPAEHRLEITTLDSNTWGPGSRWDYRLSPMAGGGTEIDVRAVRIPLGLKGGLLGLVVGLLGPRRLRSDMDKALARVAARGTG